MYIAQFGRKTCYRLYAYNPVARPVFFCFFLCVADALLITLFSISVVSAYDEVSKVLVDLAEISVKSSPSSLVITAIAILQIRLRTNGRVPFTVCAVDNRQARAVSTPAYMVLSLRMYDMHGTFTQKWVYGGKKKRGVATISRCPRRALVVSDRPLPGGRFQRGGTLSGRLRLQRQQRFGTGPFRARLYGHHP